MRDEEILYELGHYLADNLIAKSCIYVALANKKEELIYPSKNKDFTKKFPILYKDFFYLFKIENPLIIYRMFNQNRRKLFIF